VGSCLDAPCTARRRQSPKNAASVPPGLHRERAVVSASRAQWARSRPTQTAPTGRIEKRGSLRTCPGRTTAAGGAVAPWKPPAPPGLCEGSRPAVGSPTGLADVNAVGWGFSGAPSLGEQSGGASPERHTWGSLHDQQPPLRHPSPSLGTIMLRTPSRGIVLLDRLAAAGHAVRDRLSLQMLGALSRQDPRPR